MAGVTERWLKDQGLTIAAGQHRSAGKLGASPTGHLEEAYAAITSVSDNTSALLLVPRASRLRAAFGPYTLTPVNGAHALTIPVNAEAYGHRAREFDDLKLILLGPKETKQPVLARKTGGETLEVMYVLVPEADIPEDPTLIPFEELAEVAMNSADIFIGEQIEKQLAPQIA